MSGFQELLDIADEAKAIMQGREDEAQPDVDDTALAWTAILRSHYQLKLPPLPGSVCSLMLGAHKHIRAVVPNRDVEDDYLDSMNYSNIALREKRRERKET